jgi:dethiobiotin synthetase
MGNSDISGVEWLDAISIQDLCKIRSFLKVDVVRGLFCIYGSWNQKDLPNGEAILRSWRPAVNVGRTFVAGMVQVDESEESESTFFEDNNSPSRLGCHPLPPELPALLAIVQDHCCRDQPRVQIVSGVSARDIIVEGPSLRVMNRIKATFNSLLLGLSVSPTNSNKRRIPRSLEENPKDALRLFIAGDRANVGKTSICLGLLGSLVAKGYAPSSIAYIKPATQDESPQLLQAYCELVGIPCIPIGPIVFYKGFTRAFLAGETDSSKVMLEKVSLAVNQLAAGKRVVVIDGVGYPAVGSICGVDNASVALACSYSENAPLGVILVGPSGVGHAVDSFNLNSNYFESRGVPVLGAVFNKLSTQGYYSLENCSQQVTSYFQQYNASKQTFGFLPTFPQLGQENAISFIDQFFNLFAANINLDSILQSARKLKNSSHISQNTVSSLMQSVKRAKVSHPPPSHCGSADLPLNQSFESSHQGGSMASNRARTNDTNSTLICEKPLSRKEIEEKAAREGAMPSC